MDVSGLGSTSTYTVDLSKVGQTSASSTSSTSSTSGEAEAAAAPANVSKMGEAMKQLQQLQQSDPTKFKAVAAKISGELKEEARSATGNKAQLLTDLASKFESASQSGDMSSLKPPARPDRAAGAPPTDARVAAYRNAAGVHEGPGEGLAQVIESAMQSSS